MGTKYTYNNDTVTSGATVNNLTGSTIAYYGYVDEDPYLRVLSCTAAGTLQDITIGSGGSLVTFRCKTVVSNLLVSGNSADTVVSMSSGGPVISGLTVRGNGAKITLGGVEIYNVDIRPNSGARVTLSDSWTAAKIVGGYIESTTLGMSRGTIKNVTVGPNTYVNLYGSAGTDLSIGGHFVSGRVESGGQIRVWSSGGSVASTTFNSASLYMFGAEMGIAAVNRGRAKDLVFENGAYFGNGGSSFDTKKYHSGGTATNLTFRTGATMGVYSGGYVSHVTLSGESTQITISGAARVEDVTVQSGSIIKFAGGAWKNDWNSWRTSNQFASNVTIESGGTAGMANYGMLMDVTAVAGARITRPANLIGFGGENTNIAKGVIDNNELGADFQVVGGTATGLDLAINAAGRSALIIYSGLTVSGATITSGGSLFLFDGANANDIDIYGSSGTKRAVISMWNASGANVRISSGATLSIESNGAVLNGVSIFGNAYYTADKKVSGAGLVNMKGGTVSGLVISGGTMTTVANTNKKYIYNIDVTNDNNGAARTGNADIGVLNISSGTYISGGSIYKRGQLNLRQGVVEDVHFGADTWNNIYAGGSVLGGVASNGADFRMGYGNAGALISGMLFLGNAKVHMRDSRATVKDLVLSGANTQIDVSAGVVSSATLWAGSLNISGGTAVSATTVTSLGSGIASDTLVRSTGKIYQSGGSMINTSIYAGGSNLYIYDDFADDGETVVSNLVMVGVGSEGGNLSSGAAWGYQYGGFVSGATIRRAAYALSGGTMTNVNFGEYTWFNTYENEVAINNCTASDGAVIRGRAGATFNGLTLTGSAKFEFSAGVANDVTLMNGGSMRVSSGATLTGVTASDGGIVNIYNRATATGATIKAGGTMYISGTAKVTGITAESGAYIGLDLSGKTAGSGNFDSLANVGRIDVINHTPTAGTYTLADAGNTGLKVGIVGSKVFDGEVAAGSSWTNPFIPKTFTLNAAGTELTVAEYTRTVTGEAATFAQSGSVINDGDKALEWNTADIAGKIELLAASDTVAGNAWLDIRSGAAISGAQIFGTAENVNFGGKISYQIHGTGGTIGNLAAGANYGGSVKGVDILAYGNTFAGVGYAGGFGTVGEDGVQVVFGNKDTLKKDFYGGALYNAAKVAAGTSTSVSSINMQFGESAGSVDLVISGNIYGGGAVKAGTITTTENTSALQTVGDITLTLLAGTATKSDVCIFAGGYATGHDTAKEAPVYTVESVTLNVKGGEWGSAHGGRGVFGGAFASDNTASADAGVYAMVGDVNISITGGTMGNVYGGGWAQRKAFSRVGDVYISISGGTIENVFGGGSHSTTGGTTQAGDVTITVSGGTILGDIYARGQLDGDVVNNAEVIFTGANDFACGVYGYSYVADAAPASDASLTFSDYTGTFSGELGGFADITVGGNSWMTLGTAADDVSNGAWIFDFNERDLGFDGQAALAWSTADFTGDTITLRIATTRSEGWTLVSGAAAAAYNTDADKFLVEIDGAEAIALTFDAATGKTDAIADGSYAGWGFAVEDSVLKFKKLA